MILYELYETENHAIYKKLSQTNQERQYDFLTSIVEASIAAQRSMISTALIKALNYHAIACLHVQAGEYRPCDVRVGTHKPPAFHRVPALMDPFINEVNSSWAQIDGWQLSAYCLWKLNHIHPFINGNGRTARALCYYVLCVKIGRLLPGEITLPRRMHERREDYVRLLQEADGGARDNAENYLSTLRGFIMELVVQQVTGEG